MKNSYNKKYFIWIKKNIYNEKICLLKRKIHYPFKSIQLNGNVKIG